MYETVIYAHMKTFRFTGTPALYIECDVRMCHGKCPVSSKVQKETLFDLPDPEPDDAVRLAGGSPGWRTPLRSEEEKKCRQHHCRPPGSPRGGRG